MSKYQPPDEASIEEAGIAWRSLNEEEQETLRLIMEGKRNKQIAYEMHCGLRTVELRRSRIMHRFKCIRFVDLVRAAIMVGL